MQKNYDTPAKALKRKSDHIELCTKNNVEGAVAKRGLEIFSAYRFVPEALPECSLQEISTTQHFLGRTFAMPLLITGMTGGVAQGQEINEALALAAQNLDIPMGLGSQKIMVHDSSKRTLFDVKRVAPQLFVIGNIGAMSFNYGISVKCIQKLVDDLSLDAFALHLNPLQECIQPEGERDFSTLLPVIEQLVRKLSVPVMVKEVGAGISPQTFQRLVDVGVQAVDVGGQGGTSWSAIEGMRGGRQTARLGELFRNWGLPTDVALARCAAAKISLGSSTQLVATGGIRHGVQVAKAVALGATMCGVGLPLFRAAVGPTHGQTPQEAIEEELHFFQESLRIAMFCSGAKTLPDLCTEGRLEYVP